MYALKSNNVHRSSALKWWEKWIKFCGNFTSSKALSTTYSIMVLFGQMLITRPISIAVFLFKEIVTNIIITLTVYGKGAYVIVDKQSTRLNFYITKWLSLLTFSFDILCLLAERDFWTWRISQVLHYSRKIL